VVKSAGPSKSVGFSDEPSKMAEIEPRPEAEDEVSLITDREVANDDNSPSDTSELGEDEAYDEEEAGEMEEDE